MGTLFVTLFLAFNQSFTGPVVSVADGDTITVLVNNEQRKVRLAEIDAPEKTQAFGSRAKIQLSDKVFGKSVRVDYHEKDRYGRFVGYVKVDNRNVNLEMVEEGFAWRYTQYSKDLDYGRAQAKAQERRAGLWADPNPTPPWEYRRGESKYWSNKSSKSTKKKKK